MCVSPSNLHLKACLEYHNTCATRARTAGVGSALGTVPTQAAGGGEHSDIPEAKYDEGEEVPEAKGEGEQHESTRK